MSLGGPPLSFFVMTVLLFGAAAVMTGQALARNWRPMWQLVPYALLLAAGDRFLLYALFQARLWSAGGYAAAALFLYAASVTSYRYTRAQRLKTQYPWLYRT
jgi:hypothetical protein